MGTTAADTDKEGMIAFRLPEADKAELEQLAKSRERSVSAELRLAVRQWLIAQRAAA